MRTVTIDAIVALSLLVGAAALVLLWNDSRDIGRYQIQAAEVTVAHFRGRLAGPDRPETRLFRLNTRTGRVEVLSQSVYEDTGLVTHFGFWSPVDTLMRFSRPDTARGSAE